VSVNFLNNKWWWRWWRRRRWWFSSAHSQWKRPHSIILSPASNVAWPPCLTVFRLNVMFCRQCGQRRYNWATKAAVAKNANDVVVMCVRHLAPDVAEPDVTTCCSSLDDTSTIQTTSNRTMHAATTIIMVTTTAATAATVYTFRS